MEINRRVRWWAKIIEEPSSLGSVKDIGIVTEYVSLVFGNVMGWIGAIRAVLSILKRFKLAKGQL